MGSVRFSIEKARNEPKPNEIGKLQRSMGITKIPEIFKLIVFSSQ
tara:strand:- start:1325 stop:1459 length:135 start_codon:yes stop_codon:yes gene_type:complete